MSHDAGHKLQELREGIVILHFVPAYSAALSCAVWWVCARGWIPRITACLIHYRPVALLGPMDDQIRPILSSV